MKLNLLNGILIIIFLTHTGHSLAQTKGITSGTIYTLKSKSGNKLLDISNSSMENNANVDCWTDTRSDAQRWIIIHLGKSIYTLTNVASGKLLHTAAYPSDSANVDQYSDTGGNNVKWKIIKAGPGSFYLKSAANENFSLNLSAGDTTDGAKVNLCKSSNVNNQKWSLKPEPPQDTAPSVTIADKIFSAWYTSYNVETGKKFFWDRAEMMEIVLDAYEVTGNVKYKNMFNNMYNNFISNNGTDWMNNDYNDDIAWAVLFCVRGYLLTANITYLQQAKDQFDKMYARAFSNTYGGGLIWNQTKTSKNSCINGPAMVACCYLAQATGDSTYYDKAIALYTWSKLYLFDPATGKLNDNVDLDKRTGKIKINSWSSTYNQGTYLGAAVMLYKFTGETSYLSEAEKIANYTKEAMYNSRVINNEDGGNDLPGFKGIFVRYARMYTEDLHKTDLVAWLQLNARVAYNNRNSKDLIQTKWATRTSETKPKSEFGCSTAVSLLMNCPLPEIMK